MLPPEAGGPDPERVASVARRMIARMPRASQVGLGAGLMTLEGLSLARTGRTLGAASPAATRSVAETGRPPRRSTAGRLGQVDRPARPRCRHVRGGDRRGRLPPPTLPARPADDDRAGGGVAPYLQLRRGRDRLRRGRRLRRPRSRPGRARHSDRRGGRALDRRADPRLAPARPLRRHLPRRRHDDGAGQPADRAAAGPRGRRHHRDQLRHLLSAADRGRHLLAQGARPRSRRPRAARRADRRRRSDDRRRPGADGGAGPQRRTRARGRRGARLAERSATTQRARLPRRLPVRDRLPQQRQGRRPPQRPAAGVRGGGTDRQRPAGAAGAERGRPRRGVLAHRGDGSEVRITAPLVVVAAGAIPTAAAAAPQRARWPSPARPQPLDPPRHRDHRRLRAGGGALERRHAERRHRGAARVRGRPDRGHRQPAGHGSDLGPRLRHAPAGPPRPRRR